ncbi:MAG: aspartyl/asparaginyl beta-hydroxylase domain-containing protein [Deltaproteobacteria bacterium]
MNEMSMNVPASAGIPGPSTKSILAAWPYVKRSFLKLPVTVNVPALLEEYRSVPTDAWSSTHWGAHFSSNMLLLRGGQKGTADDFTTAPVSDHACLEQMPYIRSLIEPDGPFGDITYAFIFRMRPLGVARPHTDDDPAWKTPFRVHIPITTNDGALLLSEKRAVHFSVGEAWTFDNQASYAVVNGEEVRTHLIMSVQPNPRMAVLLDRAEYVPGVPNEEAWQRASLDNPSHSFSYAHAEPLSVVEKRQLGLKAEGFASRVEVRHPFARLMRAPIHVGDIIYSVNGVEVCEVARTALDYVHLRHQAGEVVRLGVLRDGQRQIESVRLYRNIVPDRVRSGLRQLLDMLS